MSTHSVMRERERVADDDNTGQRCGRIEKGRKQVGGVADDGQAAAR